MTTITKVKSESWIRILGFIPSSMAMFSASRRDWKGVVIFGASLLFLILLAIIAPRVTTTTEED